MNFALNIICKNDVAAEKLLLAENMLRKMDISQKPKTELYWKDRTNSQITFDTVIDTVDFGFLKNSLSEIAGAEVSLSASMEEWEFFCYASVDEIESGKAFLVCNVF